MSVNNKIIITLFNKIVKHKPKLAVLLPADEEDEDFDIRLLAAEIIRSFPWTIGVELRRLFSAGMEKPDRGRLDQIFKTIERTMQFLSFVILSQLLEEHLLKKISFTQEYKT